MLSFKLSAQSSIEYPRFDVDSNGQKVVVMTFQQAQSLDNSTDLLNLLEKLNIQMEDYDSICVNVINDKDKIIISQKIEIYKLKESLYNKDEQIKSLQSEVYSYKDKVEITENQISNKDEVIKEKNIQIRKMKTKMIFGGISSSFIITGLILILIL